MNEIYNYEYYQNNCGELPYDDPAWLPFFKQIADHIVNDFAPKTVLDVGCAMGHLVAALRDLDVDAYGIDISSYAIGKVRPDIKPYCRVSSALEPIPSDFPQHYDLVVTIEVAEHLYEEDVEKFIGNICSYSDRVLFSSTGDDFTEATHFNVQQREYWVKRFAKAGFYTNLNYSCDYISKAAIYFGKQMIGIDRVVENYERFIRIAKAVHKTEMEAIQTIFNETKKKHQIDLDELLGREKSNLSKMELLQVESDSFRQEIQGLRAEKQSLEEQYKKVEQEIGEYQKTRQDLQKVNAELQGSLELLRNDNRNQQYLLKEQAQTIEGKQDEIRSLCGQAEELRHLLEEQAQTIEGKQGEIRFLCGQVEDLRYLLEEQAQTTEGKQGEIRFLCGQVEELRHELDLIQNSRCHKAALKYYKLKDILIPRGSWRFIFAKTIFNFPRYIRIGYPIKFFRYIKNNGFRGLGKKIRQKVMAVPNEQQQVFCEEISIEVNHSCVEKHYQSVDIIICVHNAYMDTKKCIESVFQNTSYPFNIIIVDDGSQLETQRYLQGIQENCSNVICIRNEQGRGYTFAANQGMKASTSEYIVLLNSDTIVTAGWIDKMIACMKSDSRNGIVGPLSNTASWQSIPEIFDENGDWCHNVLPEEISIEEFAHLVEKNSARTYMQVPLLNGFCLLIARKTIEQIGCFDEETFGQGFGEEDDYNLRAYKSGIKLAIADDTFIFHSQSKSYSDEKRLQLCAVSGEKVRAKHGDSMLDWSVQFMRFHPVLEGIRARTNVLLKRNQAVTDAMEKWEGKRILILLPIAEAGGGGNVIIQEAMMMIQMGVEVWFYNLISLKPFFEQAYPELEVPVLYGERLEDIQKYAPWFDAICATTNTSVKCCRLKEKKETRTVYYVQDYEPNFYEKGTSEYREAFDSYAAIPDMVRVTKTHWNAEQVYKNHGVSCRIIGPSVNIDLFYPRKAVMSGDVLKIVAMVRPQTPRRAPELTMRVLRTIKLQYCDKVDICIFGSNPDEAGIEQNFFSQIPTDFKYKNFGKLNPLEVAKLLGEANIFVDFSSFQAMGLTSMEAMACGCAVILPIHGGTQDFAKDGKNSLVIDTHSEDMCVKMLAKLIEDKTLRENISRQAISDMCQFAPEFCANRFLDAAFEGEG